MVHRIFNKSSMFDTVIIQGLTDGDFARIDEKLLYKLVYLSFNQHHKEKHLLNAANLKLEGSKDRYWSVLSFSSLILSRVITLKTTSLTSLIKFITRHLSPLERIRRVFCTHWKLYSVLVGLFKRQKS